MDLRSNGPTSLPQLIRWPGQGQHPSFFVVLVKTDIKAVCKQVEDSTSSPSLKSRVTHQPQTLVWHLPHLFCPGVKLPCRIWKANPCAQKWPMSRFCLGIQRATTKGIWRDSDMLLRKKMEKRREGSSEVFTSATTKIFLSSASVYWSFCSDVPSSSPLIVSGLYLMCKWLF